MLYGNTPKVEVSRSFADADDDIARVAGMMLTRMLNQDIQAQGSDFVTVIQSALQDRLIPGMGCARVRYMNREESLKGGQKDEKGEEQSKIVDEWVETIYVHWKDKLYSPARRYFEIW